jgi:hypothetical protein
VNKGGEPERDDYGLPPVDIEVPDDARELDADVQAYHREIRALRRQARSRRWRLTGSDGVLRRTGLVMPLVAGCLVLAMLSGMVLTMFTANSHLNGASLGSARFGAPFPVRLPSKQIDVHGKPPVIVSSLRVAALAVIPRNCGCDLLVRTLLKQAGTAGVAVYLVGPPGSQGYISRLASGRQAGPVYPATDARDVLLSSYPTVLTVLLVDWRGNATAVPGLQPGFRLQHQLARLPSRRPGR